MKEEFDGYKNAHILEDRISLLLTTYPSHEKEYARDWLAFCRTLVTGLQLIEAVALESLKVEHKKKEHQDE